MVILMAVNYASAGPRQKRQLVLCPINSELRKCETPQTDIGCEVACPTLASPKCNPTFCLNAKGTRFNGECRCKQGFMRDANNICIAAETCPPVQPVPA
uniref:TIL domain-containing protein n=1 Tax=Plectus sambesii TaxID=2011161 RepID=A0A914V746_9BILA